MDNDDSFVLWVMVFVGCFCALIYFLTHDKSQYAQVKKDFVTVDFIGTLEFQDKEKTENQVFEKCRIIAPVYGKMTRQNQRMFFSEYNAQCGKDFFQSTVLDKTAKYHKILLNDDQYINFQNRFENLMPKQTDSNLFHNFILFGRLI
jgi:hypothetical protein